LWITISPKEAENAPAQESEHEPQVQESVVVGDEPQSDSIAILGESFEALVAEIQEGHQRLWDEPGHMDH